MDGGDGRRGKRTIGSSFVEFRHDAVFALADALLVMLEGGGTGAEPGEGTNQASTGGRVFPDFVQKGRAIDGSEEVVEVEGADFLDGFADVAGGSGFGDGDGVFAPGLKVSLNLLFADPVLVTALVPFGEVAIGELLDVVGPPVAMFFEFDHDAAVLSTFVEHTVNELAKVLGEAGDFAVTFVHILVDGEFELIVDGLKTCQ